MKDVGKISTKYPFSIDRAPDTTAIYEVVLETADQLQQQEAPAIPISIFSSNLSSLQAMVVYLKENVDLRYCEIASLLNRDQRTIWVTYSEAKKVLKKPLEAVSSELDIPASCFQDRKLSILEHIVHYLREKGSRYSQISRLLNLDQRTVWTAANRAKKKLTKNEP